MSQGQASVARDRGKLVVERRKLCPWPLGEGVSKALFVTRATATIGIV
jgi:hypothetical protein